jgi:hypothetical protein
MTIAFGLAQWRHSLRPFGREGADETPLPLEEGGARNFGGSETRPKSGEGRGEGPRLPR